MSGVHDQYLSKYWAQNSIAALERNARVAFDHHGAYFPADKEARILEIGPGSGMMLRWLRMDCGYRNLRAVDVSPEMVAACNEILPGSTDLAEETAAYLRDRQESFDFVLMLHTLEHVPKDQILPLLAAIQGALRPGGKFVVEVPNSEHPVVGSRNRYADFTHTMGFTDLSLKFVLQASGFSQVSVYGCKIPRKSLARIVQRAAQDTVEFCLGLGIRLYRPGDRLILTSALGACATK
jgi:cyclopropane fatty-acyl-phospholipid synthase-like methyltransferase